MTTTSNILAAIDAEINRLQQARSLLASRSATSQHEAIESGTKRRRRKMSAEARKKIAEAQRKR